MYTGLFRINTMEEHSSSKSRKRNIKKMLTRRFISMQYANILSQAGGVKKNRKYIQLIHTYKDAKLTNQTVLTLVTL